jgi:hypothetical protein
VCAALVLGIELAVAGRRYAFRQARQAYAVVIASLVVGLLANVLTRTNGPLCRADSALQGHALWHICVALALGGWAVAAFGSAVRPMPAGRDRRQPASV